MDIDCRIPSPAHQEPLLLFSLPVIFAQPFYDIPVLIVALLKCYAGYTGSEASAVTETRLSSAASDFFNSNFNFVEACNSFYLFISGKLF